MVGRGANKGQLGSGGETWRVNAVHVAETPMELINEADAMHPREDILIFHQRKIIHRNERKTKTTGGCAQRRKIQSIPSTIGGR